MPSLRIFFFFFNLHRLKNIKYVVPYYTLNLLLMLRPLFVNMPCLCYIYALCRSDCVYAYLLAHKANPVSFLVITHAPHLLPNPLLVHPYPTLLNSLPFGSNTTFVHGRLMTVNLVCLSSIFPPVHLMSA